MRVGNYGITPAADASYAARGKAWAQRGGDTSEVRGRVSPRAAATLPLPAPHTTTQHAVMAHLLTSNGIGAAHSGH